MTNILQSGSFSKTDIFCFSKKDKFTFEEKRATLKSLCKNMYLPDDSNNFEQRWENNQQKITSMESTEDQGRLIKMNCQMDIRTVIGDAKKLGIYKTFSYANALCFAENLIRNNKDQRMDVVIIVDDATISYTSTTERWLNYTGRGMMLLVSIGSITGTSIHRHEFSGTTGCWNSCDYIVMGY